METSRVLEEPNLESLERVDEGAPRLDLAAVYDAYAAPLYRFLLTLLSDTADAEDALQEVFLGVMRRRNDEAIRDWQAYLFQAARRQALQVLRRRKKHEKESAAALSWIDIEACREEDREMAMDIQRALIRLPVEQREVVILKLGEDLTFREIARLLGIALGTAASRYRLGIRRLRELLQGGEDQ